MKTNNKTTGVEPRAATKNVHSPSRKQAAAAAGAGAVIPSVDPVEPWHCEHGNHFCVACEDCGRNDPRNA